MDTALRNRLTGAVILVLLAVLLLPELLTGSGRHPTPVQAAATGDGPPRQTYQIDLSDAAAAPPGVAVATPAPSRSVGDEPVELPVPAASESAPADAAPPAAAAEDIAPAATPAPAETRPVPTIERAAAPPVAADGRKFFVQVGTFTTRERAEVLRSDLARRGFEVIINETARDDRRFYRVRVGPVVDRKSAEALEVRLRPLAPDRAIVALP